MKKEQTIIRNKIFGITFGIAFVCVMLFAACDNTLDLSDENGYGKISISFEGGAESQTERTVLPSAAFDKYVYTFTKSGGAAVEKTPDKNGVFTLEVGSYTVEVKAYIGAAEPYTLVASGVSSQFTVSSGSNAAVVVFLSEVNSGGQGKFSYTITYPAGAAAEITLQKWPGLNDIELNPENIANGKTQTLQLDTGSYFLAVLVNKNGSSAGISEAIHITSSLSTVYTKNFNDNDLIAPIAVLSVTVKPSTSLIEGGTEMLYAEINPSYATNKGVTWSSSNPDVAEVSENGMVTAKNAGTATITVTSKDGNKTATCNVTVVTVTVDVTSVSLNKSSTSIDVGNTETLVATIEPSNATNQNVIWSSSNHAVATVSADGTVTAIAAGTATITVTSKDGNKTATCNVTVVTVTVDVTSVSLNKSSVSLEVGGTETLVATIEPSNATNQDIAWSSSSHAVATVAADGTVTAVAAGTATITVTTVDGSNKSATCNITVLSWDVYDEASWNEVVYRIKTGDNNKVYIINVTGNFNIPGVTGNTFGNVTGITVTITGDKEISLATSKKGSLLRIGANQTVILDDTDLRGHNANNTSLVYISGANSSLTIQGNAKVFGNTAPADYSQGGGVYVGNGSTFTMRDIAEVSGNTANTAGGVYVDHGVFTMWETAKVSGNTAVICAGGVYLTQSTFTMWNNAEVSGNTATESNCGGVYLVSGTFTMKNSAKVSGNIAQISDAGGVLVFGTTSTFTMQDNAVVSGNICGRNRSGGGVYVGFGGTFTMQGGTVYGNVGMPLGNTSDGTLVIGAALYVDEHDSIAKYSDGSNILVGTNYTNNTITGK